MDKNSNVLITGGTGFIGSLLVNSFLKKDVCKKIILPVRNLTKAKKMYNDKKIVFVKTNLEELCNISYKIDYIIHCAAITRSNEMIEKPVEVADGIVIGTKNILELAKKKKIKSMVYVSSWEVYGDKKSEDLLTENELGNISLTSIRSCYPLSKRIAEHYCHLYWQEYEVPVKIARLAQVFGTGVRKDDTRIFMQIAKSVVDKKDIVLHTSGMSMGNYCASEDMVSAVFTILTKGESNETYNVVNEENTMRVKEMANLVAKKVAEGNIKVICENKVADKFGYAPEKQARMSAEKLRGLGWMPSKNLEQMYRDIIAEIK
ncbi:MAG: NAD(P)-dependent oxidoreductase [Clostridia bacterium]|nr:NAD(P)-dependent oxidoreductase [Clostridia bacterium]